MKKSPLKKSQKELKKSLLNKTSSKAKLKQKERVELHKLDFVFYENIWDERGHKCEISDNYLGEEMMVIYFHHLLPKAKYPKYRHKKWNIIQITSKLHSQIEIDPTKLSEEQYDKLKEFEKLAKIKAGII